MNDLAHGTPPVSPTEAGDVARAQPPQARDGRKATPGYAAPDAGATLWGASSHLRDALAYFDRAADALGLDRNVAERLRRPERMLVVSVPVRMDDDRVEVFTGYRVQHNDSCGPYKGGVRFAPDVDLGETVALAMTMTWKTALVGLPLGGAKGGVAVDPKQLSYGEVQALTRRYTLEIAPVIGPEVDIPAPDMGTGERHMAWMMDTYSARAGRMTPGVVTGKPVEVGGSLVRREATGRGVVYCVEEAAKELKLNLDGATFAVHGFGNVGAVAAAELHKRGARCVAVADATGALLDAKGVDVPKLAAEVAQKGSLAKAVPGHLAADPAEALYAKCDVLVPAAQGGVLTGDNVGRVNCRVLAEGANGPTTPEADAELERRGTFVIPDALCNAGGVTVSYFEWVQGGMHFFWSEAEIDDRLQSILRGAFRRTIDEARRLRVSHRTGALCLGIGRVDRVMRARGLFA